MLYQLTSWLWYVLAAHYLHSAAPGAAAPVVRPLPQVSGDSVLYSAMRDQLASRMAATAPEKCYLHTDRSLYQPGETLWFNAYVRNAGDLRPSLSSQVLYVTLYDTRGSVLEEKRLPAFDGTAAGEFDFSRDLPGGLYKIKAQTRWMRNTNTYFEREITLQKTVLPKLNLKLEFERKAYGPGDAVSARFDAMSLDN